MNYYAERVSASQHHLDSRAQNESPGIASASTRHSVHPASIEHGSGVISKPLSVMLRFDVEEAQLPNQQRHRPRFLVRLFTGLSALRNQ